jgi:hypothetical protein
MLEEDFQNWLYECYIRGELSINKMVAIMENDDLAKGLFDDFLIEWVYLSQHEFIKDQFSKFLKRISIEENDV